MKRKWLDYAVGVFLVGMLVIGLTWIIRSVNSDMQVPVMDNALAARGLEVAQANGCIACHTLDGSTGIGPTWLGMYGRTETLVDGTTQLVDADYIVESVTRPDAKVVQGYENVMVRYFLPVEDLAALVEFTRQLAE